MTAIESKCLSSMDKTIEFSKHSLKMDRTKENFFFEVSFVLYLILKFLEISTLDLAVYSIFCLVLQPVILVFIFIKIILQNDRILRLLLFASVLMLVVVSWRTCGNANLVWLLLFCIAAKNISICRIAKIVICVSVCSIALFAVLSFFGVLEDVVSFRLSGEERHSLGFSHPNTFGWCFLGVGLAFVIIRRDKPFLGDVFFLILLAVFNWLITRSITSCTLILVLALAWLLSLKSKKVKKRLRSVFLGSVLIAFIVASVFLAIIYDPSNEMLYQLNGFLSGRLNYSHYYWGQCTFDFFGKNWLTDVGDSALVGHDGIVVDNAYLHVILVQGVGAALVFFVLLFWTCIKCGSFVEMSRAAAVLFIVLAFGLFESAILSIAFSWIIFLPYCRELKLKELDTANDGVESGYLM